MRRATLLLLGAWALGFLCGAWTASGDSPRRVRTTRLAVDTNAAFNCLPPEPVPAGSKPAAGSATNAALRMKNLPRVDTTERAQLLQTVAGKPGEKEADQAQRPSRQRDLAADEEHQKIISAIPLLPQETPQEEKKEKTLWITAKPAADAGKGVAEPRAPLDSWILSSPRNGAGPGDLPNEASLDRGRPSAPPPAKTEFLGSPFDLGPALKPAPNGGAEARGILSSKPLDLPLFNVGRNANGAAPPRMAPPAVAPLPTAVKSAPAVVAAPTPMIPKPSTPLPPSPSSPFSNVEFARDSPFAPQPSASTPFASPAAGAATAATAGPRPVFMSPTLTDANPPPKRSREEIVSEKWEKYFQERKRGF